MRELLLWHVYLFGYLYRVDFIREMSTEPKKIPKIKSRDYQAQAKTKPLSPYRIKFKNNFDSN